MFVSRLALSAAAVAGLLCAVAACGGGAAVSFDSELNTPDNSFVGITKGEFKAVRFNEAGIRDGALNPSIMLTTRRSGDITEVTVAIDDKGDTHGVTLELSYDANRYHPVGAEFHGLIDSPIEAYFPEVTGTVSLGQVAFEKTTRSGSFATVRFADGAGSALRSASSVHGAMLNEMYDAPMLDPANYAQGFGLVDNGDGSFTATVNSIFAQGDGDDNSETNVADLSSLVIQGNFGVSVWDTNFGPAATDYDRNGEVNLADIAMIASNYLANVHHIDFMLSDNADMTDATVHEALAFAEGSPADRTGNPFTTTSWDTVWRTWTSTFSAVEISEADTNFDGKVFVSARTSDGTTDGDLFVPGTEIQNIFYQVSLTGVAVEHGGLGIADGEIAEFVANGSNSWEVTGLYGEYGNADPIPFTPADAGTVIPQDEYDLALAIVSGTAIWAVTNTGGDADFMSTGPALAIAEPGTGSPIFSTTFPDWDVESVDPDPEASLELSFDPAGGGLVENLNPMVFGIDVTKDLEAPEIGSSMADHGTDDDGNWILSTDADTSIISLVTWGTTSPEAFADVQLELFPVKGSGDRYLMKYTDESTPAPGEFTIVGDFVKATTEPMAVGGLYSIRVSNADPAAAGVWSSVNIPGVWFSTGGQN